MPPQDRVGRDDRGDLTQPSPSQPVPTHGEAPPFVIGQSKTSPTQLTPKDSILFDQIGQGLLLLTIEPADQRGESKPKERNVDHAGSLPHRPRFGPAWPFGQVVEHYGVGHLLTEHVASDRIG